MAVRAGIRPEDHRGPGGRGLGAEADVHAALEKVPALALQAVAQAEEQAVRRPAAAVVPDVPEGGLGVDVPLQQRRPVIQHAPLLGGVLDAQHGDDLMILRLGPQEGGVHMVAVEVILPAGAVQGHAGGQDVRRHAVQAGLHDLRGVEAVEPAGLEGIRAVHAQRPDLPALGVDGGRDLLKEARPAPLIEAQPGLPLLTPEVLGPGLAGLEGVVAQGRRHRLRKPDAGMGQKLLRHVGGVVAPVLRTGGAEAVGEVHAGHVVV